MHIAILGTGGVGGYFGAKLAHAGFKVTFVARGKHLDAMKNHGLTLKSILGDIFLPKVEATESISGIKNPDLILVAVKAWQLSEIAPQLNKIIGDETIIIPLQNGVLAADELSQHIESKHVMGGLCRILSKIEAPGVISHFGVNPLLVFGELNKSMSPRSQKIKDVFDKANINSRISDDIQADLWKKFISICVSGLLAVSRSSYGEVRECPESRQLMIDLLNEIYQLSQKIGINIEPDFVKNTVSYIDTFPYDSNSSLARDVWAGKPSEIEYQNGTVVKLGERYSFATPINRFIYNCLLPMEKRARKI